MSLTNMSNWKPYLLMGNAVIWKHHGREINVSHPLHVVGARRGYKGRIGLGRLCSAGKTDWFGHTNDSSGKESNFCNKNFSFAHILADYAAFFYAIFFALSQTKDYSAPTFLSDMIKIHLFVLAKQNCCYLYSSSCVHRGNETSVKLQFAETEKCDT